MEAILATLGYVLSPDHSQALLIHRNARPDDHHLGKYNGLGGKLEPGEDLCTGLRREIQEEAGLECTALDLAGTVLFPGFGAHGETWFVAIFRVPVWTGTPHQTNSEGTLTWTPVRDMLASRLPMWEGDQHFLPLVFAENPQQFHGVMPYAAGRPTAWHCTQLPLSHLSLGGYAYHSVDANRR